MWDLVSHSGLWEILIQNGNCTSTSFLHLQAFDFLKDSRGSALACPHMPVPLLAVVLCPRDSLKSLALVNVQFLHLPKMLHAHRVLLPQFTEPSPGSVGMRGDAIPAEGPADILWIRVCGCRSRAVPRCSWQVCVSLQDVHPVSSW